MLTDYLLGRNVWVPDPGLSCLVFIICAEIYQLISEEEEEKFPTERNNYLALLKPTETKVRARTDVWLRYSDVGNTGYLEMEGGKA